MTRALVLVALAVAVASAAEAQSVRLRVLTDSVTVGERFEITVAVDHRPGEQVAFPAVPTGDAEAGPLLALGDAEAFAIRRQPPVARGAVRTDSAVYEVAAFAVDTARVGPLAIGLVVGTDTTRLQTGVALVPVRSLVGASPEPSPLGPPFGFPSPVAFWIAFGVVAVLVLAALVWLIRRLLRRPSPATPRPAPYPEAQARLRELQATEADAEPFAVELAATVRTYLARRLGLPVLESTTAELAALLNADARVPPEARAHVLDALRFADGVKFAAQRPDAAARAAALRPAHEAVEAVEAAVTAAEAPTETASPPSA